MKINNLTETTQEILVKEYAGGEEYTLYIEPHGSTDVEGVAIVNEDPLIYEEIISVDSSYVSPTILKDTPVETAPQITESQEVESTGEEEEESSDSSEQFVCDECGAEFASARGLTSHKARAHSN